MADISKITLPSGTTYDLKDATAREAIENITHFDYVICTNAANTPQGVTWQSGSTTITGTLVASASTKGKMYLVPDSLGTKDIYDEYITINTSGSTYIWERFGHTGGSIGDLGDLAYKDSASGNFTPTGNVSQPTFTGSELTLTSTQQFSKQPHFNTGNANTAPIITQDSSYAYTSIKAEFTGTESTVSVSAPTISKSTAGATTTVNSITAVGTLPSWSGTVANETLTIAWSAGTLPTKGSDTTVKTGDASYTASAPSGTFTPSGTVKFSRALNNQQWTTAAEYFRLDPSSFIADRADVSVTGTPSGTVSQPTFTGTQGTVTVS